MKDWPSIYKKAREEARMSQERAAEAVGISLTSLKEYEAYSRIPPVAIVERMCLAYHSAVLAHQHMRLLDFDQFQVVPEVTERDLTTAAVRLYNRFVAFARKDRGRELLEIAEDGRIDRDEQPLYTEIVQELRELYQASVELELATPKGGI